MCIDEVVTDLLLQWQDDPELTPEQLCRCYIDDEDHAALLAAVRHGVGNLQAAAVFLQTAQVQRGSAPEAAPNSSLIPHPSSLPWRWLGNHRALATYAAAILLASVIALAGGVYYQNQQAESARRQVLHEAEAAPNPAETEQAVQQAVDGAMKIREELRAILMKQGGVQELLNHPVRWQTYLKSAQAELEKAKRLSDAAKATLDQDLLSRVRQLADDLDGDAVDYRLAVRLEEIRQEIAKVDDGGFNWTQAEWEYPLAFVGGGLAIGVGGDDELATRISESAIKEQLVAALDEWAFVAEERKQPELAVWLLALVRQADPDPWSDQIREPALRKQPQAIAQLAAAARKDAKLVSRLSPQLFHVVGLLLRSSRGEQEAWLRLAQTLYPADFWINFELALCLQGSADKLPEAIGFYRAALAIRPDTDAEGWYGLGKVLHVKKDWSGAVDAYRKALAIDPRHWRAWENLGDDLRALNRLPEAVYAYNKAFAGQPQLPEDHAAGHRYNAACAAVLAAAGQGAGAAKLDEHDKTRLRRQGLEWLKAECAAHANLLQKTPLARFKIQQDLQHWQKDPDLASVRENKELARLPAEDRAAWAKFWADVEALLQQARRSYTESRHKSTLSALQPSMRSASSASP